jgi:hypothetical protein
MKRFVVFSVCCLLLAVAAPVSAEIIQCTETVNMGNISIDATWDTGGTTYDVVKIYLTGITGAEAEQTVLSAKLKWQATGGQFYVGTGGSTVTAFKNSLKVPGINTYSGVNFSALAGNPTRETGTTGNLTNLIYATWQQAGDSSQNLFPAPVNSAIGDVDIDGDGLGENLLAILRVTKGTTKISCGDGTSGSQLGYSDANVVTTQFSVVQEVIPEPSTIVLLVSGLFGLVAYAWRKRK